MRPHEIVHKLEKAYKSKDLILFIGSGLSQSLGLPNWKELVLKSIGKIKEQGQSEDYLDLFENLLATDGMETLDVLTQLEKKGHKKTILKNLRQLLKIDDNQNFSTHRSLIDFCPRIITTNYDKAFEIACPKSTDLRKVTPKNESGMTGLGQEPEFIFKIHGDLDDTDSCILFESDYQTLYDENKLFQTRIISAILDKTLLFIGFSLSDPFFNSILEQVSRWTNENNEKHYFLTTDESFGNKHVSTIVLNEYSELQEFIKKFTGSIVVEESDEDTLNEQDLIRVSGLADALVDPVINILTANPMDKKFGYNPSLFIKPFEKFEVPIRSNCLNFSCLRDVSAGYLFLFTKVIKGKIAIENNYLVTSLETHSSLVDNISEGVSGVFVFVNELPAFNGEEITNIPISYVIIEKPSKIKGALEGIAYKFLTKGMTDFRSDKIFNREKFMPKELKKGKSQLISNSETHMSRYIDTKLLAHFVGRKSDIENIVRKLIDSEFENKILTIKGSGGIGKTTSIIKASSELAKRNIFESIEFISCQSIFSIENFKYQLSICLNLDSSLDLYNEIPLLENSKRQLIILDNFETLLQTNDKNLILDLVSFTCDYCVVVCTSREILDLEFEDVIELRNLTTVEGLELFLTYYKGNVPDSSRRTLEIEVVEDLLNNNPLAIKLIAKGLPRDKSIESLFEELKNNIFSNEDIDKIFEKPEDINIEKTKSLYHSIKYSYDKLNERDKLAFELLSLFPDGIHIENLKKFAKEKGKGKSKITDREIKSLDDKSLLETRGGSVKLQSIVNRFSTHQFSLRSEKIKQHFYSQCLEYNMFFISFLQNSSVFKSSDSLAILDDCRNNYLKCLDLLSEVDNVESEKLNFVEDVSDFFRDINQSVDLIQKLNSLLLNYKAESKERKALLIIRLHLIYWCNSFDGIPETIEKIYPSNEIEKLDLDDAIDSIVYSKIMSIKTCEGDSLFVLNDLIARDKFKLTISHHLYKLGFIKISNDLINSESDENFSDFEIKLSADSLAENEIENYIDRLYKKQTLEIIQVSYTLLKHKPNLKLDTSKFVVSNPYTKGIMSLINALNLELDHDERISLFLESLENLKHIRFYWVEAIIHFCRYLYLQNEKELFDKYEKLGLEVAIEYNFHYLKYLLCSITDPNAEYNENNTYALIPNFNKVEALDYVERYKNKLK